MVWGFFCFDLVVSVFDCEVFKNFLFEENV